MMQFRVGQQQGDTLLEYVLLAGCQSYGLPLSLELPSCLCSFGIHCPVH